MARPTITNLARHPHGYWTAQLADSGHTINIDTRSGSWQTAPDDVHRTREVLPHVAAVLQERVRRLERRSARSYGMSRLSVGMGNRPSSSSQVGEDWGRVSRRKTHWCGYCRRFVREKIEPRGYYGWPRIICPHCDRELGTPERHK